MKVLIGDFNKEHSIFISVTMSKLKNPRENTRIVTEPGGVRDASRAEIACKLCFYLVKSEEVYLVLLFCSMTALVPAYKLRPCI